MTAPLGSAATLRLFPLGVTGFIGLSEDVASLIDEALSGPVTGRRERFGAAVRQIQQARAAGATRAESPKSRPPRSRRKMKVSTVQVVIEGVLHDLSTGPDGISLLLPSSLVRAHTGRPFALSDVA